MALAKHSQPLYQHASSPQVIILADILSESQIQRLNVLLGWALFDDTIRQQLVEGRDPDLMTEYGLTPLTQRWLRGLPALTLQALAEQVMTGIETARTQRFPPPS